MIGYKAYLLDAAQNGDEWLVRMALAKEDGKFKNTIFVSSPEEPTFAEGERIMMYGTYAGLSLSVSGDENEDTATENLPLFELLLFAALE